MTTRTVTCPVCNTTQEIPENFWYHISDFPHEEFAGCCSEQCTAPDKDGNRCSFVIRPQGVPFDGVHGKEFTLKLRAEDLANRERIIKEFRDSLKR